MQLVKRIQLRKIEILDNLCIKSKNLYNVALYETRIYFFKEGKPLFYRDLWKLLKEHKNYLEFKEIAGSHPPQQVLKQVGRAWKSFFKALKAWKKNPDKFLGKPRIPKYKKKDGRNVVQYTSLQSRIRDGYCLLPKKVGMQKIKTNLEKCKGVRIVPYGDKYVFEIIYEKKCEDLKLDKNRIAGIDLGVNNLVAMSNNFNRDGVIIKGGIAKSVNQYYNKKLAKFKSNAKKINKKHITNRILRLHRIRNNKIEDIFHKISKKTINYCIKNNIGTIIIGYNAGWKQRCNMGKKNNQNFVQLPFLKLIHKIEYKAELVGIEVRRETEEYTSQNCSNCGITSKKNRKHRGLYVCSNCGHVINADINASKNIIKKGFPESVWIGNIGGLNPPLCITV